MTLWISLCVATGMVLHVAAVDERLGDDDEENVGLLYKVCAAVLRLMAIPKRYLEVRARASSETNADMPY